MDTSCATTAARTYDRIDAADGEIQAFVPEPERRERLGREARATLAPTPAATGPAPYGLKSTGDSMMSLPWSYAGAPALALPAGRAANSLPLGVQCVTRPGADERLLGWAPDVESVLVGPSAPV